MNRTAEEKYGYAFCRQRPAHVPHDEFSLRHPKMKPCQRAKIFSPFAALRGFEEAIESRLEPQSGNADFAGEDQEEA